MRWLFDLLLWLGPAAGGLGGGIALSVLTKFRTAGLALAAAGLIWGAAYQIGAERVRGEFTAYKAQVQTEIAAERARQKAASDAALAALNAQLAAAQTENDRATADIEELRAQLASQPPVEGRGATERDVQILNR